MPLLSTNFKIQKKEENKTILYNLIINAKEQT